MTPSANVPDSTDQDLARHGTSVGLLVAACRLMVAFDFESYRQQHNYPAAITKWVEIKHEARRALNGVDNEGTNSEGTLAVLVDAARAAREAFNHVADYPLTAVNGNGFAHEIQDKNGAVVAQIIPAAEPWAWPLTQSMTAAPDLLAALKALVESPVVSGVRAGIINNARERGVENPWQLALDAIAKAEGGQS